MIWAILIIATVLVLLYVCFPIFTNTSNHSASVESAQEYGKQIRDVEHLIADGNDDVVELTATKTALQRKALDGVEIGNGQASVGKALLVPIVLFFGVSTVLLYSQLGSPKYDEKLQNALTELEDLSLDQLVVRLEEKLKTDPANPNGWIYYARSLMTLGRHEDALKAYDQALVLTNSDEKVVSERASAVRYLDQIKSNALKGPTQQDIKAANEMTSEERSEMIQSMVDGLSQKLVENPMDQEGWVRLFKARAVLGQTDELTTEVDRMRAAFASQPDIIEQILRASDVNVP